MSDHERTAALMVPSKLAEMVPAKKSAPWFDQPAAQVGEVQMEHLAATLEALQQSQRNDSAGALEDALRNWQQRHEELSFEGLQVRGWWGRATGKSKNAGAEFADQVAKLVALQGNVDAQGGQFQDENTRRAAADERLMIDAERGNARGRRPGNYIGRIEAPAQPDFNHASFCRHPSECEEAGRSGHFEEAGRQVLAGIEHFGEEACEQLI